MGGTCIQFLVVLGILVLQADHQTVKVTEELLRQHEMQRSQEMAWLLEMEQRSQEMPEISQGSLLLSACQHWWFWASVDMLFMLVAFYWLFRQFISRLLKRKRRSRRRRRRMRDIADYGDSLDQIRSPDLLLEWEDMQNSEEEMKG